MIDFFGTKIGVGDEILMTKALSLVNYLYRQKNNNEGYYQRLFIFTCNDQPNFDSDESVEKLHENISVI